MNIRISSCLGVAGLALVVAGASAHAQTRPGLESAGVYAGGTLGMAQQPARGAAQSGSVFRVGQWPTYTAELAPGKGRDMVLAHCMMCHSVTYITMQPPLSAATWGAEVHKMINTMGAPINEADAQEIVAYLQAHYTPETRKP